MTDRKTAVVAIGGNSLIIDKNRKTIPDQFDAVKETMLFYVLEDRNVRLEFNRCFDPLIGLQCARDNKDKEIRSYYNSCNALPSQIECSSLARKDLECPLNSTRLLLSGISSIHHFLYILTRLQEILDSSFHVIFISVK